MRALWEFDVFVQPSGWVMIIWRVGRSKPVTFQLAKDTDTHTQTCEKHISACHFLAFHVGSNSFNLIFQSKQLQHHLRFRAFFILSWPLFPQNNAEASFSSYMLLKFTSPSDTFCSFSIRKTWSPKDQPSQGPSDSPGPPVFPPGNNTGSPSRVPRAVAINNWAIGCWPWESCTARGV